ncbi:hypothetical protein [Burkholderia stagnalis]|uniref:hypothetical protein n=1 Tax=Burkholderia stagnalis TaxID=1503054 RepID=UPI00325B55F5
MSRGLSRKSVLQDCLRPALQCPTASAFLPGNFNWKFFNMTSSHEKLDEKYTDITNNKRTYDPLIVDDGLPSKCLLCPCEELDERGHIIPKFVMRWLKRANKINNFYFNNDEKSKVSDTMSLRILCPDCEDKFSSQEKFFTDNFFKRFYRGEQELAAGDNIYHFAMSVAWRILAVTPLMREHAGTNKYYKSLSDWTAHFLNSPAERVPVDVYFFHGKEIEENISSDSINRNLLKYSISQGIFCQNFRKMFGREAFRITKEPVPLVRFKLGIYYFLVAPSGYLQTLSFKKKIDSCEGDRVHVLHHSDELMGFLRHASNGDFNEVNGSVIPENLEYDMLR